MSDPLLQETADDDLFAPGVAVDCLAFRERSLEPGFDAARDPHLASCLDTACQSIATDAVTLATPLGEWIAAPVVSDSRPSWLTRWRRSLRRPSTWVRPLTVAASVSAIVFLMQRDTEPDRVVIDLPVVAASTPVMRVSTRPVEQWTVQQVQPLMTWPVRLTSGDLIGDLSRQVPADWAEALRSASATIPIDDETP